MYVELNQKQAKLVKRYLEDNELAYKEQEIQLQGMKSPMVHLNLDRIPENHLIIIKDIIDANQPKEYRRRTWDDRHHTVGEEMKGWFTGKNTEEEVREY